MILASPYTNHGTFNADGNVQTGLKSTVSHEISHNFIITLPCAAKEAYFEQTALNHY